MSKNPLCQSCAMPLINEEDHGTNTGGSKSEEYCHFCFKNGEFIDKGITMEQKINKIVEIATSKMDMPEDEARELANSIIPKLKRWNQ